MTEIIEEAGTEGRREKRKRKGKKRRKQGRRERKEMNERKKEVTGTAEK